jgi:hypothetical protein
MQILLTLIIHFCSSFLMNLCLCSGCRRSIKRERFSRTASVKHLCWGCLLPTRADQATCVHVAWCRGVSTARGRAHTMLLLRTFSQTSEAALRARWGILLHICSCFVGVQSVDWTLLNFAETILNGFGVVSRRERVFVLQRCVNRWNHSCPFVVHSRRELLGWAAGDSSSWRFGFLAAHAAYDGCSLTWKNLLVLTILRVSAIAFAWEHSWHRLLLARCTACRRVSLWMTT